MRNYRFSGGTAVVTGAASGIGEQLAYGLAARGSDLVLLDRDADRLKSVVDTIARRHPGVAVDSVVADLSDVSALPALGADLLAAHPRVTLLVNNAGVALGGTFDQVSAEEFDWVLDVNFRAPVALTRLLLPRLLASPGSHVVNVSSLFGLIAPPGQAAYSASKFALRGFSEALRHELAPRGVGVTTVHPGGIRTRIAESARVGSGVPADQVSQGKDGFAKLLTYPADKAAEQILAGVEKRRGRVLIAFSAVAPDLLARLFPTRYLAVLNFLSPSAARKASSG
ncbi:SDR family NAD(P)-dependent oxidoreductase [Saccharothrix variisporea]|uniref:Short-subunit dehydrogenase n=1 Tax=Saccharothrix variisporea TaxID=543527 RepID=A0A495XLY3_9PSEU|nr:SDR family NAD(P)-dependent oxidoreductase [Saccharothrix variisporea]RKT74205.1 short-subunit dehydrogenase [Saccharothrix variisporea]